MVTTAITIDMPLLPLLKQEAAQHECTGCWRQHDQALTPRPSKR